MFFSDRKLRLKMVEELSKTDLVDISEVTGKQLKCQSSTPFMSEAGIQICCSFGSMLWSVNCVSPAHVTP